MRAKPVEEWFDDRVVASYFLMEFQKSPRKGYSTVLYKIMTQSRDWVDFLKFISETEKSTSNGGCMRAVPIGLLTNLNLVKKFARFQAEVTHKGTAVDAAEIVAVAAHLLRYSLNEVCKVGLMNLVKKNCSYFPDIVPTLKRVEGKEHLGLKTAITAVKLFERVNHSFLTTKGPPKSLDYLIRMAILLGGDTDTVAAIVSGFYAMVQETMQPIARKVLYNLEVKPILRLIH